MQYKAYASVKKYNMLRMGDTVTVGLSGGADSCALLHFLLSLRQELRLTVAACHVNHQLRGEESDRDEQFVRELCDAYHIPLYVLKTDVEAEARKRKIGCEQCGRELRYAFFEQTAADISADRIATAHTASDNAETVLFNLTRGSGAAGMCGIPPVRDRIIRPLIGVTREEVEQYCAIHGLSYVTDSTNLRSDYTRNKIRHQAVPVFREINPSFEAAVSGLSERMAQLLAYVGQCAGQALEEAAAPGGYDVRKLRGLDEAVLSELLIILCKKNGITLQSKHIELLKEIVYNGGAVELQRNKRVIVSQQLLRVVTAPPAAIDGEAALLFEQPLFISNKKILVCKMNTDEFNKRKKNDKNLFHNALDYDKIPVTAVFRSMRAGDTFSPQSRGITKPLRKLFNEQKIPAEQRSAVLLLADGSHVCWIDGIGVSEHCRITSHTQTAAVISAEETEDENKGT